MQITTDDLLQAAQMEERGMLDRKERSGEKWKQVAINEAAMAVVAVSLPDFHNIEYVRLSLPFFSFFFWLGTLMSEKRNFVNFILPLVKIPLM